MNRDCCYNLVSKTYYEFYGEVFGKGSVSSDVLENINKIRRDVLEKVTKASAKLVNGEGELELINSFLRSRLDNIRHALSKYVSEGEVWTVELRTRDKLVINTSGGLLTPMFEIGVSLDPILGIPYIPGSSIKGAWRNAIYMILRYYFPEDLAKELVMDIFDRTPVVVRVFDAYPSKVESFQKYLVIPDIITPHYGPGVKNELDVRPNPLLFLAVPKDIVFKTVIGIDLNQLAKTLGLGGEEGDDDPLTTRWNRLVDHLNSYIEDSGQGDKRLQAVVTLLRNGLYLVGETGIGAKTSVGYSKFEVEIYEH